MFGDEELPTELIRFLHQRDLRGFDNFIKQHPDQVIKLLELPVGIYLGEHLLFKILSIDNDNSFTIISSNRSSLFFVSLITFLEERGKKTIVQNLKLRNKTIPTLELLMNGGEYRSVYNYIQSFPEDKNNYYEQLFEGIQLPFEVIGCHELVSKEDWLTLYDQFTDHTFSAHNFVFKFWKNENVQAWLQPFFQDISTEQKKNLLRTLFQKNITILDSRREKKIVSAADILCANNAVSLMIDIFNQTELTPNELLNFAIEIPRTETNSAHFLTVAKRLTGQGQEEHHAKLFKEYFSFLIQNKISSDEKTIRENLSYFFKTSGEFAKQVIQKQILEMMSNPSELLIIQRFKDLLLPEIQHKIKPIIFMLRIEPDTLGDLVFIKKTIELYPDKTQPFTILLDEMDTPIKDIHLIFPSNVTLIRTKIDYAKYPATWGEGIWESPACQEPAAIIYGPMKSLNQGGFSESASDVFDGVQIARKHDIPFISLLEYAHRLLKDHPLGIMTGLKSDENGIFLDTFPDYSHISITENGPTLAKLEAEYNLFFAYLNREDNSQPLLLQNYLIFLTRGEVIYRNKEPIKVFAHFKEHDIETYLAYLKQNHSDVHFTIHYENREISLPADHSRFYRNINNAKIKIFLENPFPLKKEVMLGLMQCCARQKNPIFVTGDQSLSEAISIGGPFFYQVMDWKKKLATDLSNVAEKNNLIRVQNLLRASQEVEVSAWVNISENYNSFKERFCGEFSQLKSHICNLSSTLPAALKCIIYPTGRNLDIYLESNSNLDSYRLNNQPEQADQTPTINNSIFSAGSDGKQQVDIEELKPSFRSNFPN